MEIKRIKEAQMGLFNKKFSIEVMPKTAQKVRDFSEILPSKTLVYIAHLEDTDISDMKQTCVRLIDEGMIPMPHIPARILRSSSELEEWVS